MNMDFKAPAVIAQTRLQASVTTLTEKKAIVQVLAWQADVLLFEANVVEVLVPWRTRAT
jgi:acyl-CoA thioesterase FadM